jgi:transposase
MRLGVAARHWIGFGMRPTAQASNRCGSRPNRKTTGPPEETATLQVSLELSQSKWVLTVRAPGSAKLSRFTVPARDTEKVLSLLTTQREQMERRTARPVRIVSIYEAGLEGFWLHRWLEPQGVESHVVDAASILVPQRRRNAKTDRIDGEKLLRSLTAWLGGEIGVYSMVVPPSVAQEDLRRMSRERGELLGSGRG